MSKQQVSLTLLKQLVSELETVWKANELIRESVDLSQDEAARNSYVAEMGKAAGLLSYIANECSLLNKDFLVLVQYVGQPKNPGYDLESLLGVGGFGKPGSNNFGN